MEKGWVAIHRSICENDLWFLEPFTKAQAWIDLVLNANHKDGEINIRGNIIHIKRGQIGWSQITMAKRWRWSRQKVRRFLEYLIIKQMISIDNSEITPRQLQKTIQQNEQQKKRKLTSITTIINYEQYQTLQQTIQQTIQQKDNRRYTNNNDNNDNNIPKGKGTPLKENTVNLLQKALKDSFPIPLTGITDRKRLHNLIQVLSPRKGTDEWMDTDWKSNFVTFLNLYLEATDEKYYVRSVDSLKERVKLWREYRGKLN